ncbi:12296_t:CDS:2, partial [Funneliformis caledonium]
MGFSNFQSIKSKKFIAIIVLSFLLHLTLCDIQYLKSINEDFENDLTFEESNSNPNGMILLRFSKNNNNNIYLRIVPVNGSTIYITVNKSFTTSKMNAVILNEEYILILYAVKTNTFGLLSSWTGDIIDIIDLEIVWYDTGLKSTGPSLSYGLFINKDVFSFAGVRENVVIWKRFKLPNISDSNDRNVIRITEGNFSNPLYNLTLNPIPRVKYFQLIDGGFGFAISYRNEKNGYKIDEIYVNFLEADATEPLGPYLLNSFKNESIRIEVDGCINNFDGTGYTCTTYEEGSGSSQIRFLSTGAVMSVGYTNIDIYSYNFGSFFYPNFYGGYIGFIVNNNENKIDIYDYYGVISSSEINKYNGSLYNVKNINVIQKQNVFWILQKFEDNYAINYYSLNTIDPSDYRYIFQNPNINNTSPSINDTIYLPNENLQLKINYNIPVILSTGKLTIYQYDEKDNLILRQIISGQNYDYCNVLNDTVSIKILPSTFHKGYAKFGVRVDNNFVKSRKTKEPLLGISENIWTFSTQLKEQDEPADQLILSIKLNFNNASTAYYDEINSQKFGQLENELSKIIPINQTRLKINRIQNLNDDQNDQILISIAVNKPYLNDYSMERNTESVKKDLDELIKNKDMNLISQEKFTRFIDKSYGATLTPEFWSIELIVNIVLIALVIIIYCLLQYYMIILIVYDLILDITFLLSNANDIPGLYIYSLLSIIIPIALNTIVTLYLLCQEIKYNENFRDWCHDNTVTISSCTILSCVDVEALHILNTFINDDKPNLRLGLFKALFSAPEFEKITKWVTYA